MSRAASRRTPNRVCCGCDRIRTVTRRLDNGAAVCRSCAALTPLPRLDGARDQASRKPTAEPGGSASGDAAPCEKRRAS